MLSPRRFADCGSILPGICTARLKEPGHFQSHHLTIQCIQWTEYDKAGVAAGLGQASSPPSPYSPASAGVLNHPECVLAR